MLQSCLTLCDPMDYSLPGFRPWDSPGKNTRVGCQFLFQGIFPTQGWNPGLRTLDRIFTTEPPGKPPNSESLIQSLKGKLSLFSTNVTLSQAIIKGRHDPKCTAYIINDHLSVSLEVTIPLINPKRERYRVPYFTGRLFTPGEQEEQHMRTLN